MPKPRRRRNGSPPRPVPASGSETVEEAPDGAWVVRRLTGSATSKTYRCPGCDQEIRPATPHLVTWPAYPRDSDLEPWDTATAADWRRHWHATCWRARDRRR